MFLLAIGVALGLVPVLSRLAGWIFVLWPLVPAALLVIFGLGLLLADAANPLGRLFDIGWRGAVAFSVVWIIVVFWRRSRL